MQADHVRRVFDRELSADARANISALRAVVLTKNSVCDIRTRAPRCDVDLL
jgi:hypothetical protein